MQWQEYTPELEELTGMHKNLASVGTRTHDSYMILGDDLLSLYQYYQHASQTNTMHTEKTEEEQETETDDDTGDDRDQEGEEDQEDKDDGDQEQKGALASAHLAQLVEAAYSRYKQISNVHELVAHCIGELQKLEQRHRSINESTKRLHDKCDTLMKEYAKASSTAQRIAQPLFHFDCLGPLMKALLPRDQQAIIMPLSEIHTIHRSFQKRMEMNQEDKLIAVSSSDTSSEYGMKENVTPLTKDTVMTHADLVELGNHLLKEDEFLFAKAMAQMDQSIAFLQNHNQYRDASVFLERYLALRENVLERCRSTCIQIIQRSVRQVEDNAKKLNLRHGASLGEEKPTLKDARISSMFYVRFRNACQGLMSPLLQLHLRSHDHDSHSKLISCHTYFIEQRVAILRPFVLAHLRNTIREHKKQIRALGSVDNRVSTAESFYQSSERFSWLLDLIRKDCHFMMRVVCDEYELFHSLCTKFSRIDQKLLDRNILSWNSDQPRYTHVGFVFPTTVETVRQSLRDLSSALVDTMRPVVLVLEDLDILCEVILTLKEEILEGFIRPRGMSAESMKIAIRELMGDAQERLLFRAQTDLVDAIAAASPQDYLASCKTGENLKLLKYPDILMDYYCQETSRTEGQSTQRNEALSVYETWYPPLEKTLLPLSKLYRTLDKSAFEDLAQDAVVACSKALVKGSEFISKVGSANDGDLFLIRHLLILREQLAPFNVDLKSNSRSIDFSNTVGALSNLLSSLVSLLSRSFIRNRDSSDEGNSSLQSHISNGEQGNNRSWIDYIVGQGLPSVTVELVDSRRDLELVLKSSCDRFIRRASREILGDLMSFISEDESSENGTNSRQLPSVDDMSELAGKINHNLEGKLPHLRKLMAVYLGSSSTQSILFKPIQKSIYDALTKWRCLVQLELDSKYKETMDPKITELLREVERSEYETVDPHEAATSLLSESENQN